MFDRIKPMKVLVACEFSHTVRDAFLYWGHDAYSCDIIPSLNDIFPKRHIQCDVTPILKQRWDLVIAHPPCTYLSTMSEFRLSPFGVDNKDRIAKVQPALDFWFACINANAPKVCVENPMPNSLVWPVMKQYPYTIIQPWQFGANYAKKTLLWLKGLLPLRPRILVKPKSTKWFLESLAPNTRYGHSRNSITYQGIAKAMALQWGTNDEEI